jgi:hypothetical protein
MIWEQRVHTIAMLTKLKEGGREKVFQVSLHLVLSWKCFKVLSHV